MKFEEISLALKEKQIKDFAQWASENLGIETVPTISITHDIEIPREKYTYGTTNSSGEIWVHVGNRTAADAMRTLCHELIHHRQFELGIASDDMSEDRVSFIEDQANAVAGKMLRVYGKQNPSIY